VFFSVKALGSKFVLNFQSNILRKQPILFTDMFGHAR